jgi:hypothetical protein
VKDKREEERSARPGRKPKDRPNLPNLARKTQNVVGHILPDFPERLDQLPDPRDPSRTVYGIRTIVWSALFLFLFQLRSRRHFRTASDSSTFLANLNRIAGEQNKTVPHPDTITPISSCSVVSGSFIGTYDAAIRFASRNLRNALRSDVATIISTKIHSGL